MWRRLSLLALCCAVSGLDPGRDEAPLGGNDTVHSLGKMPVTATTPTALLDRDRGESAAPAARAAGSRGAAEEERMIQQPTAEPLEDETDNQENIIAQLLGDYDKVKTASSGSDCVCRCIVRPIKRSHCSRILDDPESASQPFYTVETVTKGTDCKMCVCTAPSSAVNPCEGEYRFKKLQEAGRDDIKLSTIIDLLEGSMYGMDLLKLHSVTTKLLTRMDNMEKAFTRNLTERSREKERGKERVKEKEKERKAQQKKKKGSDLERTGQKHGASSKQKSTEERSAGGQPKKIQSGESLENQQPTRNKTATQKPPKDKTEPKQPIRDKNSMVIRGVTFYKAEREKSDKEEEVEERGRGENTSLPGQAAVDLLISDQIPQTPPFLMETPGLQATAPSEPQPTDPERRPTTRVPSTTKHTPTTAKTTTTTIKPPLLTTTTPAAMTTPNPTTTHTSTPPLWNGASTGPPIDASPTATESPPSRKRLSWTESPADQPETTKKPALCKDTVASLSEPVQQNLYGHTDGAWMRDARGHGNVIYLTNGHYGDNLLEFRDLDTLKSGQASNSYKLPYGFTGTGHVVYNGAFYYNRAFSRDVIRYDLRHRYVAAWTTLHDAILEEQVHRTQTEVEFAVDESGLWLLYPALDTEGFHQEVILLNQLRPQDLQPIQSFRTGLRRGRYGNSFLVCGVLYGVDSMERLYANVTYAFDTHTLTHTMPSLAFTNMHTHTSQLSYCPLDKKLYAWDNGHQMNYDVIFAY
ncbi:olfactomedin-like protein 2B [Genypterus blacodes]|uniref:olfactomedin-like protein 2B n=1 Tax=Genypterus blacodes TaxID=154954 RepID=UPI003F760E4D